MNQRKVFWFVLLMAAFVLVGVWRIAGGAGVLLAVGSVGLYLGIRPRTWQGQRGNVQGLIRSRRFDRSSGVGYFLPLWSPSVRTYAWNEGKKKKRGSVFGERSRQRKTAAGHSRLTDQFRCQLWWMTVSLTGTGARVWTGSVTVMQVPRASSPAPHAISPPCSSTICRTCTDRCRLLAPLDALGLVMFETEELVEDREHETQRECPGPYR